MHRFTLVSREECGLCEEMLTALQAFCHGGAATTETTIEIVDVDSDPELRRRYSHRVPVLLLDGEAVCQGRFDAAEVARLVR